MRLVLLKNETDFCSFLFNKTYGHILNSNDELVKRSTVKASHIFATINISKFEIITFEI